MDKQFPSTDVGTLFLDRDLRVRRFTPKICETFQVLPQDIGRRIDRLTHNLLHEALFDDLAQVLQTESSLECEVRDRDGKWFLMQVCPHRSDAGVEGLVLSLTDIAPLKAMEKELGLMSKVFRDAADPIIIEDLLGCIIDMNEEADGFEVARQARRRLGDCEVYLVALTGYGQDNDRQAVLEGGQQNGGEGQGVPLWTLRPGLVVSKG